MLAGVGFENKYSIAFLLLGLLVGVVLTPHRHFLKSRYLWLGVLACAVIALPNFLWQVRYQFPFLELIHNIRMSNRDVVRGPVAFIADQATIMNPILFPLWAGGVIWLFFGRDTNKARDGRRYRLLGWTFLVVLADIHRAQGQELLCCSHLSHVVCRRRDWIGTHHPGAPNRHVDQKHLRRAGDCRGRVAPAVLRAGAFAGELYPLSKPRLAFSRRSSNTSKTVLCRSGLPTSLAGRRWSRRLRSVYNSLPPEERARTAIFSNGWGEAAAVDFYGPRYGLPQAISKHNSYWIWGPGNYDGSTVIILRSGGRDDREYFQSVEAVGHVEHPYARRDEYFDILLCRGLKFNLQEAWPRLKKFD